MSILQSGSWSRILETKSISKSQKGRKGRAAGKRFETQVRKDLEAKGWFVVKWTNQIDFEKDTLIPAKSKFNPFLGRVMSEGSGFPDFLCFRRVSERYFDVTGVESKLGKYLDAEEKKKAEWLLAKGIFNSILVAYKKERGKVEYENFREK